MQVTSVAITSNVATLAVKILEGYAPSVGDLVSVQGTQTATSGGAPNFNVSALAIAAVSGFNTGDNSAGTISFALTSSNISTTADAGRAISVPQPTMETLPASATAGQAFAVSAGSGATNNQRGLTWWTQFTGSPSTVTMNLQGSDVDEDSYYTTVDTSSVNTGESRSLSNINYAFYRVQAASTGGTSPKCLAGIMTT